MTTHNQHQEDPEFTSSPADFADRTGSTPPPVADPSEGLAPRPGADDGLASDAVRNDPVPHEAVATTPAAGNPAPAVDTTDEALFADHDLSDLRSRWNDVQATFVDDPRQCVQKADGLVSDTVEQLTSSFSHARSRLEEQWARGEQASTEDLRLALKRYRDFFDRLLAV